LRDIGEARLALETANEPAPAPVRQSQYPLVWALAVIAVASLAVSAFALWQRPAAVQKISARLTIPLPPGAEITSYPAITRRRPDCRYVAQQGMEDSQLYLRDLNSFEGSRGALFRAAPSSRSFRRRRWVAFFAQGQLQKQRSPGCAIRVVEATYGLGGTWNETNTIIYTATFRSGLYGFLPAGERPKL